MPRETSISDEGALKIFLAPGVFRRRTSVLKHRLHCSTHASTVLNGSCVSMMSRTDNFTRSDQSQRGGKAERAFNQIKGRGIRHALAVVSHTEKLVLQRCSGWDARTSTNSRQFPAHADTAIAPASQKIYKSQKKVISSFSYVLAVSKCAHI